MRSFLLYVCRRVLDDSATEIREQEIGANVFGRAPDYDSSQDPLVRVQASHLRKKLQQYFETEGAGEPLVLEIPKGAYMPAFRERSEAAAPAPAAGRRWVGPLAAAVVLLAVLCAWLGVRDRQHRHAAGWQSSAALASLWSNFFGADRPVSVVVADSCLGLLQDAIQRPIGLNEYLRRDYAQWIEEIPGDPALKAFLRMLIARQYTSLADVGFVKRILAINPDRQQQITVVFARNYQVRGASVDTLILLGSKRSNPWVELFEKSLNFRFDYDETGKKAVVRNLSPQAGESATYLIPGAGVNIQEGFASVAYLQNLGRNGHVLIIAGSDMEATEAAGQFVTVESQLGRLIQKLPVAGRGQLPYFEVLLKTRRVGGAPSECEVLAWRAHSQ